MLRQKQTERMVSSSRGLKTHAERLRDDKKFRRELSAALEHAGRAVERAQKVEEKRTHRLRNGLLLAGGGVAAAASSEPVRQTLTPLVHDLRGAAASASVVQESLELEVAVSPAYNQWTQFEQFPQFMDGVEEVRQLDDSRLHWIASIGGRRVEWDAKILEQHPDRQISWASEDGRKTRGTVSFEPLGEKRTRVTLSMSYQLESVGERIGAALGVDRRRVRTDLQRFKQLIEAQGHESGGWRGEISGAKKQTAQTDEPKPAADRSSTSS